MINKRLVLGGLILLSSVTVLGLFIIGGSNFIVEMGRYIPQDDLFGDYLVGLTWATFLGLSIFLWPVSAADRGLLQLAWAARALMTMGIMLFSEHQYDADAFGYFGASREEFDSLGLSFGQGTRTMITLTKLHRTLLPFDSYHMMKVTCSLLGLIAIYLFYRGAVKFWKRDEPSLFLILALYPSILFWSSILGKDPVILLGIAIYFYAAISWQQTSRPRYLVMMAFGIVETMYIRMWMGAILLAPLGLFVVYRSRNALSKMVFIGIVAAGLYATAGKGGDMFNVGSLDELVSTAQRYRNSQSVGGSRQRIGTEFTGVGGIAAFTPVGMFTALFRPLPGDVNGAFGLLASIENSFLLLFFVRALRKTRLREWREPTVAWACALILIWSAAYGILSYQNLGAAVRYKLQILPVMVCLILYLNRPRAADARKPAVVRQRSGALA